MCALMLMHVIAHGGCTNIIRESALKVDSGEKNMSVLRLDFHSDALPTALSLPLI